MVIGKLRQALVVKITKENCLDPPAFPILLMGKGTGALLKRCS